MRARGREELRQPRVIFVFIECAASAGHRTAIGPGAYRSKEAEESEKVGYRRAEKTIDERLARSRTASEKKQKKEKKRRREKHRKRKRIGTKRGRVCERSSRQEQPRRQSERGGVNGR